MTQEIKVEFDVIAFESDISAICSEDVTLIEAITIWAEKNDVEFDIISSIVKKTPALKLRIEECARSFNQLKR